MLWALAKNYLMPSLTMSGIHYTNYHKNRHYQASCMLQSSDYLSHFFPTKCYCFNGFPMPDTLPRPIRKLPKRLFDGQNGLHNKDTNHVS